MVPNPLKSKIKIPNAELFIKAFLAASTCEKAASVSAERIYGGGREGKGSDGGGKGGCRKPSKWLSYSSASPTVGAVHLLLLPVESKHPRRKHRKKSHPNTTRFVIHLLNTIILRNIQQFREKGQKRTLQ